MSCKMKIQQLKEAICTDNEEVKSGEYHNKKDPQRKVRKHALITSSYYVRFFLIVLSIEKVKQ